MRCKLLKKPTEGRWRLIADCLSLLLKFGMKMGSIFLSLISTTLQQKSLKRLDYPLFMSVFLRKNISLTPSTRNSLMNRGAIKENNFSLSNDDDDFSLQLQCTFGVEQMPFQYQGYAKICSKKCLGLIGNLFAWGLDCYCFSLSYQSVCLLETTRVSPIILISKTSSKLIKRKQENNQQIFDI